MTPAIELRELTIGYRRRRRVSPVAAGLAATARRGELTVVLGPNGCGKSTLLRTLCGLQPAVDGQVLLDGTDLDRMSPAELARQVAVVLTDRVDAGLLSARELVGLGRIPHLGVTGRLAPDDETIIDSALTTVNAAHLADHPAAELSDGERQRVLTARALAQQPTVLVLDEPTAFLDVPSRAGLVEMLRGLARKHQLAIVLSTHELELALRMADRAWLLDATGALSDATPEELVLGGQISALFDGRILRFDADSGVFGMRHDGRSARIDATNPLGAALQRAAAREGWVHHESAEIVVTAPDPGRITVRAGGAPASAVTLGDLPTLLRTLPTDGRTCAPEVPTATLFAELSRLGPYFTVSTGPVDHGWQPVERLYTDPALLDGIIDRLAARIGTVERRVAVSTLFLGFAARLWSIGLGALAGNRLLADLAAEHLLFRETDGQIGLHIERPVAWDGDGLEPVLADMVLARHLGPLGAALRRGGPIAEQLLRGNAVSALFGAARVLDGNAPAGPGWQLARRLCDDERLSDAVRFAEAGYRRNSCCLYYRTRAGGLCGDCALTGSSIDRSRS